MKFNAILNGRALYTEKDRIWVAKGMTFYAIDYNGKRVTPKYSVGGMKEKAIGAFRLSRQLLRQGLHHLVPLSNGDVFVTAKKISYIVDKDGNICPLDGRLMKFSVTGAATYRAAANGDPTCLDIFHEPQMHAFGGMLTVIVQAGETAGEAVLNVSAKGLKNGTINFELK